jgi:hypothetical protein
VCIWMPSCVCCREVVPRQHAHVGYSYWCVMMEWRDKLIDSFLLQRADAGGA